MWVTAPRKKPLPMPAEIPRPATPEQRWTNLDYISNLRQREFASTFYGGEALPTWHPGYPGNKCLSAFLDCPLTLDFNTGWLDPILTGEDIDYGALRLDEEQKHFRFALRALRRGAKEARGKSVPSIGHFGGSGDTLAALRSSKRLLYDLIDRPQQVGEADMYLMHLWCKVYDRFYEIIKDAAEGSTCWPGLWSPGKFFAAQNDFSYMISPRMYARLFLPSIEKQTQFLDHTVYHVDGTGAFAHVDALCELPRLQAIQILPGAGKPSPLHYADVLRKVQAAGKNLHITIASDEVQAAMEMLSARGLFISTACSSEEEAKALLKSVEKWSRQAPSR